MTDSGEGGEAAPKRELFAIERFLGIEKTKLHSRVINAGYNLLVWPAVWFRENVIEPNRQESYWYHWYQV
jgi:hypothetical protein